MTTFNSQKLCLNKGWNLVGISIINSDFKKIISDKRILEIKDFEKVYNSNVPENFNTLNKFETCKGYFIKTSEKFDLIIDGDLLDYSEISRDDLSLITSKAEKILDNVITNKNWILLSNRIFEEDGNKYQIYKSINPIYASTYFEMDMKNSSENNYGFGKLNVNDYTTNKVYAKNVIKYYISNVNIKDNIGVRFIFDVILSNNKITSISYYYYDSNLNLRLREYDSKGDTIKALYAIPYLLK